MSGAGAAGIAICRFLLSAGAKNVILCDRSGADYNGRPEHMNWAKDEIAKETNPNKEMGNLAEVLKGADVFLAFRSRSGDHRNGEDHGQGPYSFAMANPTPEIYPDEAQAGGAAVVATGRSDFPNQINNCLGLGIFRGTLDVRANTINEEMKLAASEAIASLISDEELTAERIIPEPLDSRVVPSVAKAVAEAARRTGVARI